MPQPPPPLPSPAGALPPAPGEVQRMVAQSGFVVYEPGTSVFDESLLVYRAKPKSRDWPDFDVFDHVGRPLAATRLQVERHFLITKGPCTVFDPGGSAVLHIRPRRNLLKHVFDVTGVAAASFSSGTSTFAGLSIEANNEPFGWISGNRARGLHGRDLTITDHDRQPVGAIRILGAGLFRQSIESYVVRLDPGLDGPLRRLVVAAPVVLAMIRRAQKS